MGQSWVLQYPVHVFKNSFIEFSFYVAFMSMIAGVLSLVFSINKTENLTLKTIFEKPSVLLLLLFGVVIELFAASTRALHIENLVGSALVFGLVYMAASFLITFYNNKSSVNRYLMIAMFFGLFNGDCSWYLLRHKPGKYLFHGLFCFRYAFRDRTRTLFRC